MKRKFNNMILVRILALKLFLLPLLMVSQTDSTHKRKNEVGTNLGPIVTVLLGSGNYSQPFSATYKRVISKWAFRMNYSFYPNFNNFSLASETKQTSDTSYTIRSTNRKQISHVLRCGVEYRRKFKRGWSLIGGADISYRYVDSKHTIVGANFHMDSVHYSGTAQQSFQGTLRTHENLLNEYTYTSQVGLGLSVAVMVPLTKRFVLLGQCRADAYIGQTRGTSVDNVAGTKTNVSSTSGDLITGPLLSELGIYYRF